MDFGYEQRRPNEFKCVTYPVPPLYEAGWKFLYDYLEARFLDAYLAEQNGWFPTTAACDQTRRIVIPATRGDGGPSYWQARSVDGHPIRYQSPPIARGDALVVVYPYPGEEEHPRKLVVVEGPMDALAAAGAGYLGVALMGATPSAVACEHLATFQKHVDATLLVADADAVAAMVPLMAFLSRDGHPVKILPARGKDLASMSPSARKRLLR